MRREVIEMADALAGALLREQDACEVAGHGDMALVVTDAAEALLALLDVAVAQGLDAPPCGAAS